MCSNKITKTAKNVVLRPNSDVYTVCRHGKSELEVDFETRSRSKWCFNAWAVIKSRKNGENALKMQFEGLISACIYLSKRGIRKRSILKPKVEVVVFLRIRVWLNHGPMQSSFSKLAFRMSGLFWNGCTEHVQSMCSLCNSTTRFESSII